MISVQQSSYCTQLLGYACNKLKVVIFMNYEFSKGVRMNGAIGIKSSILIIVNCRLEDIHSNAKPKSSRVSITLSVRLK